MRVFSISASGLKCITCESSRRDMPCKPQKCGPSFDRCFNMSYSMNLAVGDIFMDLPNWQAGCGSESQCMLSEREICDMTTAVWKNSGLDASISDCKIKCNNGKKTHTKASPKTTTITTTKRKLMKGGTSKFFD